MSSERVEALSFALEGELYCVDTERVRTVLTGVDVARAEAGPDYVYGTARHGGETLLVIDIGRLFGNTPPPGEERDLDGASLVVFDSTTGDQANTWAVDEAGSTVTFDPDEVVESGSTAPLVYGLVTVGDRTLTWVDPAGINP